MKIIKIKRKEERRKDKEGDLTSLSHSQHSHTNSTILRGMLCERVWREVREVMEGASIPYADGANQKGK